MTALDTGIAGLLVASAGETVVGWLQQWWPWLLVAVLGVVVISLLTAFIRWLRISLRVFLNTQMPMTADTGNGKTLRAEVHEFPSRDGTSLMGVFIDPPAGVPVRGTVVFSHEFRGDRNSAARYTAGLPELGFRVFTFDFRGHGESSNSGAYQPTHWATDHEVNDVLGAVAYVEATAGHPDHPVVIMGVSRGAAAAAVAALHAPTIRALVLDGLFSTDMMVEGLMKRWARIFSSLNLVRAQHPAEVFAILRVFTILYAELKLRCRYPLVRKILPRIQSIPMLLVYGEGDTYIAPDHRIKLYRIKGGVKQLHVVPGAKHNQAVVVDPEGYRRELVAFVDSVMPPLREEDSPRGA